MIYSRWHKRQRLGNWLWQYVVSRIVAEELGYTLDTPLIKEFPNAVSIKGKEYNSPSYRIHFKNLFRYKDLAKNGAKLVFNCALTSAPFIQDYGETIRNKWLYVENTCKDINKIKDRFKIKRNGLMQETNIKAINKNDIVVNVRLREFLSRKHIWRYCGFDYFDFILKDMNPNRIFIVSDDIKSNLLDKFAEKYNAIFYVSNGVMDDFNFVKLFNRILIGHSSFSWWAAYLSKATEIYIPVLELGYPRANEFNNAPNENRYQYVNRDELKMIGGYKELKKKYHL